MRGLTLICVAMCIVAAPAHADTFKGRADIGPALAGDTVVWGEELPDGRAILYSRAPGQPRRALVRIPAATQRGHSSGFGQTPGGVTASTTRMAYTASQSVSRRSGPDTVGSTGSVTPQVSVAGGPFANPFGTCSGSYVSTAIEGDVVAVAIKADTPCGGVYVDGRKVSEDTEAHQVRLAGPYVAWVTWPAGGGTAITIADAATGALVARFTPPRDRSFGEFDIDEHGNVVTAILNRLVTFSPTAPKPRTLAREVYQDPISTAAGRVVYQTIEPRRLVVADLASGRVLRTLQRFGQRRWSVGETVLTDRLLVWSVRSGAYDDTYAPGTIRVARL
jgi:hypothetical protein